MRIPLTLALLVLVFVVDAADAGRGRLRRKKRRRPVPTQPAPAPAPLPPGYSVVPDGTYTGELGGQQITFTATPMAFFTLYGELPHSDPAISHAYVSGNYQNWMSTMGITFVYMANSNTIPPLDLVLGELLHPAG